MFYRPAAGRLKDGYVLWHDDRFYLFSMYSPEADREDYRNVWMAESDDGVHFRDVGPVIQAPFEVWAMSVSHIGDRFILNHGSFSRPGVQNVIRFWESSDLVHWTYCPARDLYPDSRRHAADSRLDCMDVIPVIEAGGTRYYGYATGPGGFLESPDGIRWHETGDTRVEWGSVPRPPTPEDEGGLEIGGCQEIGGRYYLLGGWFNYMGFTGYGTYTLVGDAPTGPFRPDAAAYRLCGNSTRWVALWARFCRTPDELLVTNSYMYSGYTYETGETWLPPLKRAEVDEDGHLRLRYWPGNDAVKGAAIPIDLSGCVQTFPAGAGRESFTAGPAGVRLEAGPERPSFLRTEVSSTVVLLGNPFDLHQGVVLEGVVRATCRDPRLVAPTVGLFLEERDGEGTALLLDGYGTTRIGKLSLADEATFECEDVVGPGCASPAGIAPHLDHAFRLLARMNLFELYLDDRLVQTFNTTHAPDRPGRIPRRIGLIAQNGQAVFADLKTWAMNLAD